MNILRLYNTAKKIKIIFNVLTNLSIYILTSIFSYFHKKNDKIS